MSKPQFVLEEALEAYLDRLASPYIDRDKTIDSIVDARVYGKLGRVCKSCIDKYCRFPIQRILFKEALARHLKAVKDITCNCLFCRNLNKQSTAQ